LSVTNGDVRAVLPTGFAALVLALPAAAAVWQPPATWLVQAQCVHLKEAAWSANSGNGYFGGMQFSAGTWRSVGGKANPALTHPGNPAYPFSATPAEQLYRAWRLWRRDRGTWKSWGAVGASCSS
jgi:hypothetical protein